MSYKAGITEAEKVRTRQRRREVLAEERREIQRRQRRLELIHYVYMLRHPAGEAFYIGKGTSRRWRRHVEASRANRNPVLYELLHYYLDLGFEPQDLLQIVREGMNEADAVALERAEIAKRGLARKGGHLLNLSLC